jgi:hypothetical protein
MDDACRRGAARFALRRPGARSALERRIKKDPRIGELCEAYEMACSAVDYWLHSPAAEAAARADEYRALAMATEQDIIEALS